MKRLRDNKHILHVLKNCNSCLRKSILKNCSPSVIKAICEIALNTLNGNNKIDNKTYNSLKKYKKDLRRLAGKNSLSAKRSVLVQRGGFLPFLIGTVLTGIIGKLIENYSK